MKTIPWHEKRKIAFARHVKVWKLHRQGYSLRQIAKKLGYKSHYSVQCALKKMPK